MRHNRLRWMLPLMGGQTWQEQLLSLFPAGDDVGIKYNFVTATTLTTYWLYKHLYQNRYWRIRFGNVNLSVGQDAMTMNIQDIADLFKAYNDQSTPAITLSGSWTAAANESYPTGRLVYTGTAGRYAEITGIGTSFGAMASASANYVGVAKVLIDGDATLADLLPTAQDLVTSGALADTVLVANGGSLNPTDRIWDQYNNSISQADSGGNTHLRLFTTSLPNVSHTVRILVTGYKNSASSGANVEVFCMLRGGPSVRTSDPGFDIFNSYQSVDTGNTWEISYSFTPEGTANAKWLGHAGQAKITTAPTFTVDGAAVAPTDEVRYSGSEIILTQTSSVRHSDIGGGATDLGTYVISYKMNKSTGLTISHSVTWATNGTVAGYPCMMSVNHTIYDRFKTYGNDEQDLTANNDAMLLNSSEQAAWCWDYDGNAAAIMYMPSLATVDNWMYADASPRLVWMDISISGGAWKKAYAVRYKLTLDLNTFESGQVVTSEANYRVHWFADGANTALAGKF